VRRLRLHEPERLLHAQEGRDEVEVDAGEVLVERDVLEGLARRARTGIEEAEVEAACPKGEGRGCEGGGGGACSQLGATGAGAGGVTPLS